MAEGQEVVGGSSRGRAVIDPYPSGCGVGGDPRQPFGLGLVDHDDR